MAKKKDKIKNKEIIEMLSKKDWEADIYVRGKNNEKIPINSISETRENGKPVITIDIDLFIMP